MKKNICIVISLLFLSLMLLPICTSEKIEIQINSTLEKRAPITINGNEDFTEDNGVVSGEGTSENPYVISNLEIHPRIGTGITIKNTTSHYIIDNCNISSKGKMVQSGIFLINASNGKVTNSYFSNCKFGVGVISTKNTVVEKCYFKNCEMGLTLNGCPTRDKPTTINNTVRNCTFCDNSNGIYLCCLPNSYNNLIEYCNFFENTRGILFDHLIHYILVTKCNFTDNGIGIRLKSSSSNNYITGNIFSNKNKSAINAWTFCNEFWDNGEKYGGNYWDDYNGTGPYEIVGTTDGVDNYPLENQEFVDQIISFFYSTKIGFANQEIKFDGSLSYPQKSIVNYTWDFDDGEKAYGKNVKHIFENEGEYFVTLNISDGSKYDVFSSLIDVNNLSDKTIIVNDGEKIQDAIDIAKPGETILIKNGRYQENIVIDTPFINLIGENKEQAIIDANGSGNVVSINAPYITISKLTIEYSGDECAGAKIGRYEYIVDAVGCKINDTYIQNNYYGILAQATNNLELTDNQILFNADAGIYLDKTHSCVVKNNNLTNNEWYGIENMWGSNWNLIEGNLITKGNYGIDLYHSNYVTIKGNEITENLHGIKIYDSIYPEINYNNIFKNKRSGIETLGAFTINNYKNNWYGSRLGPGSVLGIFGDSVTYKEDDLSRVGLKSIVFRYASCYPWEKQKITISLTQ